MCETCEILRATFGNQKSFSPLTALKSWEKARDRYEDFLDDVGLGASSIDEIACLAFDQEDFVNNIWNAVKEEGVELFNVATDKVVTSPLGTEYVVDYAFLRMPSTMRVEMMEIRSGFSPVHQALMENHRSEFPGIMVHLSFKCESLEDYEYCCSMLRQSERASMVQSCESTYGRFSYWSIPECAADTATLYLKPRVNLRDRGEFGMPTVGGGIVEDIKS